MKILIKYKRSSKKEKLVNFYVDIVAEDDQGKVIIENQFNNSDHDHLGKLITLDNVADIKRQYGLLKMLKWRCKTAEWLNQNSDSCLFYLVKIQILR